jgi:hypothetical protein
MALIIDDLLIAPVKGIFWVFQEVCKAAEKELEDEVVSITQQLSELYRLLENGSIAEEAFVAEEGRLLDRLDELQEQGYWGNGPESDEEDEDEDEESDEDEVNESEEEEEVEL